MHTSKTTVTKICKTAAVRRRFQNLPTTLIGCFALIFFCLPVFSGAFCAAFASTAVSLLCTVCVATSTTAFSFSFVIPFPFPVPPDGGDE
ncbi:MAG: hypothetical protein ACLUE6_07465 [Acutalibacteraceae bacterium]